MLNRNTSLTAARRAPASRNPLDPHGDPEGIVLDPKQLHMSASSVLLAKRIGDLLERKYPGWLWAIEVDERGGVTTVRSLRLSGQWGWRVKTVRIQDDPQLKLIQNGAGEILERFRQRRGAYNRDQWRAAPRYLGMVDFDISDKSAKTRRRHRDDALTEAVKTGRVKLIVRDTVREGHTTRQLYMGPGDAPSNERTKMDITGGMNARRRT